MFGTVASLLNVNQYIAPYGIDFKNLLVFSTLLGFGGAFFSLLISKIVAKLTMRLSVIKEPKNSTEKWLVETVAYQANKMNIKCPEVAYYESNDMNAFATGPSKNNALVAVSTGLLNGMNKDEVEAVLGHEVAHIANGDMVTSTLLQGVLNTFVIFFARTVGFIVDKAINKGNNQQSSWAYMLIVFVFEIIFGLIASIIVAYHSRRREFFADQGGAKLVSKQSMINALSRLGRQTEEPQMANSLKAFGIRGGNKFLSLFSTHPPIEERIKALYQS